MVDMMQQKASWLAGQQRERRKGLWEEEQQGSPAHDITKPFPTDP